MWTQIRFTVDGDRADAWADALLEAGAASVDTADADAGSEAECALFGEPGEPPPPSAWPRTVLTALVAEPEGSAAAPGAPDARARPERAARALLARAARLAGQAPPADVELRSVADEDWVRATQREFDAFPVGRRLWITPSWHADVPAPDSRIPIVLDPGLAFGTGSHPTTRLCLEWLDEYLRPGESMIDYGCGSGILAIAAARLGAGRATGIDIDPQALVAAQRNAEVNGVRLALRSSSDPLRDAADVVVANILANPLRVLAPLLESLVAPGGRLVLAGLLERQAREIARCYASIDLVAWRSLDGWTCLAGTRRA